MATVQPIRDISTLQRFKDELMVSSYRNYIMALIGLNTGLRIGDIVNLQVKDVRNTHIQLKEQKTKKGKRFTIEHIKPEIDIYIQGMEDTDYLFESRQVNSKGEKVGITTTQAYRALKQVANKLNIKEFGTHTLRKTFGYHYYKRTKDIAKLMDIFNHSSQAITKEYIGINQEEIDNSMEGFYL